MLEQLVHNGVIVPDPPDPPGLTIVARGRRIALTPKQEEMALAWARKKDTVYAQDEVFLANFMEDFSQALGIEPPLRLEEVDFSAYYDLVDEERRRKEALTPEERKEQAAARRREREELKARYGYAIVNGQRVELGTYMVEPSGIFMGRGQHPLRGRWKEGATQQDITLNYGPHPEEMEGEWAEVIWQPESLWVARWKDKLSGKLKYIWLGDTAPVKQRREAQKFDQALRLDGRLEEVRRAIGEGLVADNPRDRMVATACYLIDFLCLRVGDEKEADEADTVGATTLRPEHITLHADGSVEFRFLGKDSVEWHKTIRPEPIVYQNLAELILHARPSCAGAEEGGNGRELPQLFPDITSRDVNAFLSSIIPGLSAKMFRTYHATKAVERSLQRSGVIAEHPEYRKWEAASLANLAAAELCNHTKQVRGNWESVKARYEQRIAKAQERIARYRKLLADYEAQHEALKQEVQQACAGAADEGGREKLHQRYAKRLETAQRRIGTAKARLSRAEDALGKIRAQMAIAQRKRRWNTNTSLRSYIDPRVYHRWGQAVDYDVLNSFYPTTLRRKYAWVQHMLDDDGDLEIEIRPCMPSDLGAVLHLVRIVQEEGVLEGLSLDREALAERLLPDLEKDWRETVIALGDEEEIIALGTLGPVRLEDERPLVDCLAVIHSDWRNEATAEALAAELARRYERFTLMHPRKRSEPPYELAPRSLEWCPLAPGVAERLGLFEGELIEEEAEN